MKLIKKGIVGDRIKQLGEEEVITHQNNIIKFHIDVNALSLAKTGKKPSKNHNKDDDKKDKNNNDFEISQNN